MKEELIKIINDNIIIVEKNLNVLNSIFNSDDEFDWSSIDCAFHTAYTSLKNIKEIINEKF